MTTKTILAGCVAGVLSIASGIAHDTGVPHKDAEPSPQPWPLKPETKGPVKAPALLSEKVPVSGQGFWKFVAVSNVVPVPDEALSNLIKAHGTLLFDAENDTVYWGLKSVGWVGFSNQLRDSWVVKGDDAFAQNNLHGADILPRKGQRSLIAAADNEGSKVYLTDTTFLDPQILGRPTAAPFNATNVPYRPTDVAFVNAKQLFITDGYGSGHFMSATTKPFAFEPGIFGGRDFSKTPHGITFDPRDKNLLLSARPEGQLKRWSIKKKQVLMVNALPKGTLLCDVDLWGDYALAACLDGADKKPGPLMIVNLKTQAIVSIIKPKEDLGYEFAGHMHDACWYFHKNGRKTDVYIVFTAWNPGGIGALKLVNVAE